MGRKQKQNIKRCRPIWHYMAIAVDSITKWKPSRMERHRYSYRNRSRTIRQEDKERKSGESKVKARLNMPKSSCRKRKARTIRTRITRITSRINNGHGHRRSTSQQKQQWAGQTALKFCSTVHQNYKLYSISGICDAWVNRRSKQPNGMGYADRVGALTQWQMP